MLAVWTYKSHCTLNASVIPQRAAVRETAFGSGGVLQAMRAAGGGVPSQSGADSSRDA